MLKIIGLGNHLCGDDFIGLRIIEELRKMDLPDSVQLIEAGADAFSVLEHLIETEPVLLIDCAKLDKNPGDFAKFDMTDKSLKHDVENISLHGFSFAEVYSMAQKMGPVAHCSVIGIQPGSIEFNTPLSEDVEKNIPHILKAVQEETKNVLSKSYNY